MTATMPMTKQAEAFEAIEREVKLHINEQLYNKGYISEQMYLSAKLKICYTKIQ